MLGKIIDSYYEVLCFGEELIGIGLNHVKGMK